MLSSDDTLGRSGDNRVRPFPASSDSPNESVLPGTRWLCSISLVAMSLSIAQPPNLTLRARVELACVDFCCLSALVCHAAGRAVKISLALTFGSKKNQPTSAECFQGIHQAGRTSEIPKKLLSPPNLNTCFKTHKICWLVLCLRNASC